jgi:hypothetical protein
MERMRYLPAVIIAVTIMFPGIAADDSIHVSAKKDNDCVVLDASFSVPVSRDTAWAVLTDFEHMAMYLPYLSESKIIFHEGNFLRIHQKGAVPFLFFHVNFDSTRSIEIFPETEIQSHTMGGDSGLSSSTSKLSFKNNQAEIVYHAEWWSTSQMTAGFGIDTLKKLINEQFIAMRKEMIKRASQNQNLSASRK